MNNKLLLQDLTDQLAEAGKIKKKDAEEFLRAFFKVSEDALFEDGIVKINGLGTLKLVLVDARKSVNVSTGEEFEIREHYKVSFIPDADLKNLVNQPYAHLEPVELDGGTENNSAPTEKKIVEKKTVTVKEKASKIEELNEKPKNPKKIKRSTIAWVLFFLLIVVLGVWSWISNDISRKENVLRNSENELIDSLEADAALQQDLAALEQESDTTLNSTEDDSLEAVIQSVAQETGDATPAATPADQKVVTTKQVAPVAKQATAATKPTTTVKPEVKPTVPVAKAVETKTPVTAVKPAAKATTSTVKATKPAEKIAAKTSEPANGTEYIATVVLKPGDRLNLLALKYYGDKIFWVYIYEANKSVIPKPDNVPTGITIRIPKPDPKIIDPKNEALIAKAKALQLKYIGAQ